jgi:hypothetical protein
MNPEHLKLFRNAIDGSAADLLDNAHSVVRVNDFFSYSKLHNASGKPS